MGENHNTVLGQMYVRFDGIGTHGLSADKGSHGILGIGGAVATMGNRLRVSSIATASKAVENGY